MVASTGAIGVRGRRAFLAMAVPYAARQPVAAGVDAAAIVHAVGSVGGVLPPDGDRIRPPGAGLKAICLVRSVGRLTERLASSDTRLAERIDIRSLRLGSI